MTHPIATLPRRLKAPGFSNRVSLSILASLGLALGAASAGAQSAPGAPGGAPSKNGAPSQAAPAPPSPAGSSSAPAPSSAPSGAAAAAPSGSASAAPSPADILFEEGRALLEKKDFAAACAKFEASQKLDPAPGTLFNLATCEEGRLNYASAARRWSEALAALPPDDPRREIVQGHITDARQKASRLTLRLGPQAPPGTTATLDGRALAATELGSPILVDPGKHHIVVSAAGHEPRLLDTTVSPDAPLDVALTPGAVLAAPALSASPTAAPSGSPSALSDTPPATPLWHVPGKPSLILGIGGAVLAGVGVGVAAAVGPKFHEIAQKCNETPGQCTGPEFDPARTQAAVANTFFGVGAALGLAAVIVYFVAEPDRKPAQSRTAPPATKAQASLGFGPNSARFTLVY